MFDEHMQINRHNYETYFLLWVDGELSGQEEEMVERFIVQHPDLAEELVALQETKLPLDEPILFANKESLLKVEHPALSISSYETYFLLYIDNELSTNEKADVELFVLQHPQLQAEFMLLKQTKLTPEQVIFINKELLYRKEEKERPVIYLQWRRIAVAAALIGLIFSLWMIESDKWSNKNIQTNAANNNAKTIEPNQIIDIGSSRKGDTKLTEVLKVAKSNPINLISIEKKQDQLIAFNSTIVNAVLPIVPETDQRVEESIASLNNSLETSLDNVQIVNDLSKHDILAQATVTEEEQPTGLIKQTVYRELDTDESSKSLYVGALEINKDKLRGFIRKAGTIFRSKSKQDEDKIVTNK